MGDEMELDVVEKYAENVLKFEGKTLIEYLAERDSYFNQENPTWIFDGDTIEFISVNFFNSKSL